MLSAAQNGDKHSRDLLIEENMGLVWSIVRRYTHRGCEAEDLFQIGAIGLMKAIDHFDIGFGVKFSTYAVPMISGEIRRHLRDDGMIKVSRSVKDHAWQVQKAREKFGHEHGREASVSELCACTGLDTEDVMTALEAGAEVESLDRTLFQSDGQPISLMDRLEDKKNAQEAVTDHLLIAQLLDQLDKKARELIIRRYYCGQTQTQIAEKLGVSQVQVSRLEKRVLKQLREKILKNA